MKAPDSFYQTHYAMNKTYYSGCGEGIQIKPETLPTIIDQIESFCRDRWTRSNALRRPDCDVAAIIGEHDAHNFGADCIGRLLRGQLSAALSLRRHFKSLCTGQQLSLF